MSTPALSQRPICTLLLAIVLCAGVGMAQDLEPRAYSASPVGVTFVGGGFGRSAGVVVFDPALPITDARATIYGAALGLGHTFGLFGRQTLVTGVLPYDVGHASGNVGEQQTTIYRSGLADAKLKFAVNFHGSPAMTPKEFARRKETYIIAGSVVVNVPIGQYSGAKLVNIGTNRWAIKPELGFSYPLKRLYLDLYAAAWFYRENPDVFPGGNRRSQDPLPSLQAHASYTFPHNVWLALDAVRYSGGALHINDGPALQRQNNIRAGATFSMPIRKSQSVKITYSSGVSGRVGTKFNSIGAGWQYVILQ